MRAPRRWRRRREDVAILFAEIERLPGTLDYAAKALEAHAHAAASFLTAPPASAEELQDVLFDTAVFAVGERAQPLAVPADCILINGELTHEAVAGLHFVITRNCDAVKRFREDAARARLLAAVLPHISPDTRPQKDARQIYATRFISPLLAGSNKCPPATFAKHVTTAERFARPLARPADGAEVSGDGAADDDDAEAADDDADSECRGDSDIGGELDAFEEVVGTDDEEGGADEDEDSDADESVGAPGRAGAAAEGDAAP